MTGGALMVVGTASDVGKSRLVAGLCRLAARRGIAVAPFKAQNMSLNSTVTASGHEIARSQAHQAVAASTEPVVEMNPVLVKPEGDGTSQLVVMGRPAGRVRPGEAWPSWRTVGGEVTAALRRLRAGYDLVLLEGAGGAAEINLLDHDLSNLPLAAREGLPAVLVGDIERGGVFASIFGTVALLPDDLRATLRGFVINKFRGDERLLASGIAELERRCSLPCLGVVPHVGAMALDEEDSLALGRDGPGPGRAAATVLDVAVAAVPRMANFTDLDPLRLEPGVRVRHVRSAAELASPDLIVLPGSKTTVDALVFLRETGLAEAVVEQVRHGSVVVGICAGYQLLGTEIVDDVESGVGRVPGLGLLPVRTVFAPEKVVRRRSLRDPQGHRVAGYELHHGRPETVAGTAWFSDDDGTTEGLADADRGVFGTSLHGVFDVDPFRTAFLADLARRRHAPFTPGGTSYEAARQAQIDRLADVLDRHLDVDAVLTLSLSARPPT